MQRVPIYVLSAASVVGRLIIRYACLIRRKTRRFWKKAVFRAVSRYDYVPVGVKRACMSLERHSYFVPRGESLALILEQIAIAKRNRR